MKLPTAGYKLAPGLKMHKGPISSEKAIKFAVRLAEGRGVRNITVCDVNFVSAPIGGALVDMTGDLSSKNERYTVFRVGVNDGTEAADGRKIGDEFVFLARGKNSNGERTWLPPLGKEADEESMSAHEWTNVINEPDPTDRCWSISGDM